MSGYFFSSFFEKKLKYRLFIQKPFLYLNRILILTTMKRLYKFAPALVTAAYLISVLLIISLHL